MAVMCQLTKSGKIKEKEDIFGDSDVIWPKFT